MTGILTKGGNLDTDKAKTQGEGARLQAKEISGF